MSEDEERTQRKLASNLTLNDIKAVTTDLPMPSQSMEVREAAAVAVGLRVLSRGDLYPRSPEGKTLPKPALFDQPIWCRQYAMDIKDPEALGMITRFLNLFDAVESEQVRPGARVPFKKVMDIARTLSLASDDAAPSVSSRTVTTIEQHKLFILHLIEEMGIDPMKLPDRPSGKAGIASELTKLAMKRDPAFTESKFKHAWDGLRADKRIFGAK